MVLTGRWFAENSVWTAMVTILSVLLIDYARDPDGHKIEILKLSQNSLLVPECKRRSARGKTCG